MAHVLEPASDPLEGTSLAGGTYRIERFVGSDDLGRLYRARQIPFERAVHLRVLHGSHAGEEQLVARFHQSGLAAGRIQHRNVLGVADLGQEADGSLYLVTEYHEGRDLRRLVAEEGPLAPERVIDLAAQLAAALTAAHAQGVIHRDVRPESIFVVEEETDDGEVIEVLKLGSFGVARVLEPLVGPAVPRPTVDMVQGDPGFMSPEQCNGAPMDGRSDVYGAGCVAYFLGTGRPPFEGELMDVLVKHVKGVPEAPSRLNPDVPAALDEVILRALAKSPSDRHQGARQLRLALKDARGRTSTTGARPVGAGGTRPDRARAYSKPGGERHRATLIMDRAQMGDIETPKKRPRAVLALVVVAVLAAIVVGVLGGLLAGRALAPGSATTPAPLPAAAPRGRRPYPGR